MTRYLRSAAGWTTADGFTHIDPNLRSLLDALDLADQRLYSPGQSEHGLGDELEIRVVRRVDRGSCSGSREGDASGRFGETHDASSLSVSAAATADVALTVEDAADTSGLSAGVSADPPRGALLKGEAA